VRKIFTFIIALLILIETSLIFISVCIDFKIEDLFEETNFLEEDPAWADTLLAHMDLDEKVGQLFVLELDNAIGDSIAKIDSSILKQKIGGIKFKNTELVNQVLITNLLQSKTKYPLLIGSEGALINQENYNLPIGPIINSQDDSAFTDKYLENFAEVLKHEGVQMDFSNSLNLNDSVKCNDGFSDNINQIIYQSTFLRKKLHSNRIFSCINFNDGLFLSNKPEKLDSAKKQKNEPEIEKFFSIQQEQSITKGIIEKKNNQNFDTYLKTRFNFNGLIISTIIDTSWKDCISPLFKSGTDLFVVQSNPEKYILELKNLIDQNIITEPELNNKVRRILMAKKWAGLDKQQFRSAEISLTKIYTQNSKILSWQLYENSLCLIKNKGNSIPLINLLNNNIHILSIGKSNYSYLQQYLNYYLNASISSFADAQKLQKQLLPYKNIVVAIDKKIDLNSTDTILINNLTQLSKTKKMIVINFGNLQNLEKLQFAQVILQAYDNHPLSQIIASQIIAGSIEPKGTLVPKISRFVSKPAFHRIERLQYTTPEAVGFNSNKLNQIDTLVAEAISIEATPGCQILAAKDGKVFYYKSFGNQIYWDNKPVQNMDIYDLASITKVAATTMTAMKLYENGKIKLNDSIKYYIEDTIHCTIKNHQLRDFFIHQSGLQPDMPILQYIRYRKPGMGRFDKYYSYKKDSVHSVKVAEDFYFSKDYLDSIVFSLYNLEWDSTKSYEYSDINFNIIYDVLRRKTGPDYVKYLNSSIYNPLQLRSIGFLPIERFSEYRIAPTQEDKFWRKQLLRGYPHDESAAIYGGISGNAGLFSNANDLAILFQMLLNGGTYGGKKVFEKSTIEYFTSPQDNTSRGLGFAWHDGFYGHTGFTGCVVWANPETKMIFIFLSNSVYPKPANQKLKKMKIRSRILNLILSAYNPKKLSQIDED
jgi:CubicO group peptidase (beta-lactamase class C family)